MAWPGRPRRELARQYGQGVPDSSSRCFSSASVWASISVLCRATFNSLQLQLAGASRKAFTAPPAIHAKDARLALAHADAARKVAHLRATARTFRLGLRWQLRAMSAAAIGLWMACCLGRKVFWTRRLQWWALAGIVASIAALVLNAVADGLLLLAPGHGLAGRGFASAAQGLSLVRFSAAGVAALIGLLALCTTFGRLARHSATKKHWDKTEEEALARDARDLVIPPSLIEAAAAGRGAAPAPRRRRWTPRWPPRSRSPARSFGVEI